MDDLDRLFRHLVEVLAIKDPKRLTAPFQISELYQSILPYREYKNQLGFECSEDYEMAVLRLFSGEANYADVEPDEVKEQLVFETQAVNPNPGAYREFAAARVKLNQEAVRAVRGAARAFEPPPPPPPSQGAVGEQWGRFAPPEEQPTGPILPPPDFEPDHGATATATATANPVSGPETTTAGCPNCNETLPANRPVLFCPFCGWRIGAISCPDCGDEIEVGWNFCASCGKGCPGG